MPFDLHSEVVGVWRQCLEKAPQTLLYSLACMLAQIFDELYFKSVYLPLNVTALNVQKPSPSGTKVRVYNAPEHRWWVGSITDHDPKQNMSLVTQTLPAATAGQTQPEALQVWVSVPSFYAEVLNEEAEPEILLSDGATGVCVCVRVRVAVRSSVLMSVRPAGSGASCWCGPAGGRGLMVQAGGAGGLFSRAGAPPGVTSSSSPLTEVLTVDQFRETLAETPLALLFPGYSCRPCPRHTPPHSPRHILATLSLALSHTKLVHASPSSSHESPPRSSTLAVAWCRGVLVVGFCNG